MKTTEKHLPELLALVAFVLMVWNLQATQQYMFFDREQQQVLAFVCSYLASHYVLLGGLSLFLSHLVAQFFCVTFMGACLTALLGAVLAHALWLMLRKVNNSVWLYPLCYLPVVLQFFCLSAPDYRYQGFVSLVLMALALWLYAALADKAGVRLRPAFGALLSTLVFFLLGSVATVFALMLVVFDVCRYRKQGLLQLLSPILVAVLGFWSVEATLSPDLGQALLYRAYNNSTNASGKFVMFSWIAVLAVAVVFALLRYVQVKSIKLRMTLATAVVLGVVGYALNLSVHIDRQMSTLFRLHYDLVQGRWDDILQLDDATKSSNMLYLNYVNLALAQKGQLSERLFNCHQMGTPGLFVGEQDHGILPEYAYLYAHLYYFVGDIAGAQNKAFDAYQASNYGNPTMLKLLVKTSLIYGNFKLADKYLSLLEKTWAYRSWASQMRPLIGNENAVRVNKELAFKRKDLPKNDFFFLQEGSYGDLLQILRAHPENRGARDYIIAYLLLSSDKARLSSFVEEFYGTKAMPALPVLLQQELLARNGRDIDYCKKYGVSNETISRYRRFIAATASLEHDNDSPQMALYKDFGDTYWYYSIFNNIR